MNCNAVLVSPFYCCMWMCPFTCKQESLFVHCLFSVFLAHTMIFLLMIDRLKESHVNALQKQDERTIFSRGYRSFYQRSPLRRNHVHWHCISLTIQSKAWVLRYNYFAKTYLTRIETIIYLVLFYIHIIYNISIYLSLFFILYLFIYFFSHFDYSSNVGKL